MPVPSRRPHHKRKAKRHKPRAAGRLLAWYDVHRRDLPWRAEPGAKSDPYRVWLSEIMLQQTTVPAVKGYYRDFLKRWPNVNALADASLEDVRGAWAGLGYYTRARNLHRTAKIVAYERGGKFPPSAAGLRELPGIGPYTAAAIAAIALGERIAAIDANAERVLTRLFAIKEPPPKAKRRLAALADALVPENRPGDFAQALMDLGALVCLPKRPRCGVCPLSRQCRALALGIAGRLPRKAQERPRPLKRGAAFVAFDRIGAVYLVRRPENGLLGGMLQPPLGGWSADFPERALMREEAPFDGPWIEIPGLVRHGFTHFLLELTVFRAGFAERPDGNGLWLPPAEMAAAALPTVMKKVIRHALSAKAPAWIPLRLP